MLASLLQYLPDEVFQTPRLDWHALAPEIVLTVGALVLILLDSVKLDRARAYMPTLANITVLGALIPIITLAVDGTPRVLFDGAYVVDSMSLVLKALFLVATYVVVLLSTNYVAEGDYWESEYYSLLLTSTLGMVFMCSARDLITIFLALELLSMPAYMLASWRKADVKSNEAGMKYFLMGIFASAVMLYGMSLLFGVGKSTRLDVIAQNLLEIGDGRGAPIITIALIFVVIGFAFKVSSVPFHFWAPDVYEGAPTPVTAFLAVSSKTGGFVALIQLVFFCFYTRPDIVQPVFAVLAVLSMTVGNLIALKQENIVRMLAYSGIAHAGFMLAAFAVVENARDQALSSIVVYLVIYAAMNLGAFAVVIAVARKTRSAEITSYAGLFKYAPGLTVMMTFFLASLTGIPPFGGWFAKLAIWQALVGAHTGIGYFLAIVLSINAVISAFYYLNVCRAMWFEEALDGDVSPVRVPPGLVGAILISAVVTLLLGVAPGLVTDVSTFGPVAAVLGG
ncbi:MAG: NADH-quinone oxidoreductase subunit N [Microthrixaceae bacterium]